MRTSEKVLVDEVRQPESNTSKDEASLYDVLRSGDEEAVLNRAIVDARPNLQVVTTGDCVDTTGSTTRFTTNRTGSTTGFTTTHTTEFTTNLTGNTTGFTTNYTGNTTIVSRLS